MFSCANILLSPIYPQFVICKPEPPKNIYHADIFTYLKLWKNGFIFANIFHISIYLYYLYPISVRSNLEPIEPRFIKK